MSPISGDEEPQQAAAAVIKIQSLARGHLLRKRLKRTTAQPEVKGVHEGDEGEGEGEGELAARASCTSAARGDAPEVLTDDRFVGSEDGPHARAQRDAAFYTIL